MAFANGVAICQSCRERVDSDLAAEQAGAAHLPLAVAGGLGAALVSGIVWAVIAVVTGLAIGYVAVGVGWLAGLGVLHGARGRRGRALQGLAVGCATLGLLFGKYFIVAHAVREMAAGQGVAVSYVDPRLLGVFAEVLPKTLSPFDALWLFLALGVAWGIPRRTEVTLA
jgi:hypothetical protein